MIEHHFPAATGCGTLGLCHDGNTDDKTCSQQSKLQFHGDSLRRVEDENFYFDI
ncbi:MAG: hypothetical protein WBF97_08850 [Comamonas sp.]